jgi:hypothetical protein
MPADEEIKKLQAEIKALQDANAALASEKGKAETEKAVAEARRATILAQIPPTDTKALEGKLSLDTAVTTEIQKLAQEALSEAIHEMVLAIRKALPALRTVLIYNDKDLSTIANYSTVIRQLKLLVDGYRRNGSTHKPEAANEFAVAPLLAPAVAGTAVKSVIDLISLFRTNVDIKGATVTFEDASLVAHVGKQFRAGHKTPPQEPASAGIEIIYSALYLPGMLSAPDVEGSGLLKTLKNVSAMRQNSEFDLVAFDAKTADEKVLDPDRERIGELKSLNSGFDKLLTGIGTIEDKTSLATMTSLLRGEVLSQKIQNDESVILFVKAVGGGENKTTQKAWGSAKLTSSGTAILTYLLFTVKGGLGLSDVISRTKNAAD